MGQHRHHVRHPVRRPTRVRFGPLRAAGVALVAALAALASAQSPDLELQTEVLEARVELARLYEPIEAARDGIDRLRFDVGALAFELAFDDADTIAAAVRERVRFEPYRGVLRGAQGALASGGANSADLALLLAVLLGDAGYEVELRRATLDDAGVEALLGAISTRRPADAGAASAQLGDVDAWMADEATALAALAEQHDRIGADVSLADDLLAALFAPADVAELPEPLVEALRDYVWVAHRFSERDAWTDLHGLFEGTPAALADLEPSERVAGTLPSEWTHQLSIQAFLERRRGSEIEVVPIMDPYVAAVANMYGEPITFATAPDGVEAAGDAADVEAVLAATSLFWPIVRGDPAAGAMTFDLLGNTVPPAAAASGFAGVFATSARALGGAMSALGGIGVGGRDADASDVIGLSAIWLDIALIAPDGERSEHRRVLVDRRGAEARAAGDPTLQPLDELAMGLALMRSHTFMLDPGRYADAYVLDRVLGAILAGRDYLDAAYAATARGAPIPVPSAGQQRAEEAIPPLLLLASMAEPPVSDDVVSYRPSPGLVIVSGGPDGDGEMVDVVANPRWSLRVDATGVAFAPRATFTAGAFETRVEGVVLDPAEDAVTPAYEVVRGGAPLVRLAPGDEAAVAALELPFESRLAILDDLGRGYHVVVASGAGGAVAGWWRADLATGELLGRGGDGRGLSFTEYLATNQIGIYLAAALTGFGMGQCMSIESGWRRACCMVQNAAIGAAGVGLGYAVAAALAQTIYASNAALNVLLFVKMDVQVGFGTMLIPPVCGT